MKKFGTIFIHGVGKIASNWNVTENNKNINIEKEIAKKSQTILVSIENYEISPVRCMEPIIQQIKDSNVKKWIIVCHSLGVIHGLELLKHNLAIIGINLIDPTALDTEYIDIIRERGWIDIVNYCENISLTTNIQWIIHLDYDNNLSRKVTYYKKYIGANDKSAMILHPGKGHMIHYTDTAKIIHSITSMMK